MNASEIGCEGLQCPDCWFQQTLKAGSSSPLMTSAGCSWCSAASCVSTCEALLPSAAWPKGCPASSLRTCGSPGITLRGKPCSKTKTERRSTLVTQFLESHVRKEAKEKQKKP